MKIKLDIREFSPENFYWNRKMAPQKIEYLTTRIKELEDSIPQKPWMPVEPAAPLSLKDLNRQERNTGKTVTSVKNYYEQYVIFHHEKLKEYRYELYKHCCNLDFAVPYDKYALHQDKIRELQQELQNTEAFLAPITMSNIILEEGDVENETCHGITELSNNSVADLTNEGTLNLGAEFALQINLVVSTFKEIRNSCNDFLTNPYISEYESAWLKKCLQKIDDPFQTLKDRFDNLTKETNSFVPESIIGPLIKNLFTHLIALVMNIFNGDEWDNRQKNYMQTSRARVGFLSTRQEKCRESVSIFDDTPEDDTLKSPKPL